MMHSMVLFTVSFMAISALEEDAMTTYFRLYELGAQFYREKNFTVANSLFEKAMEDYHFYHENVINCRVECRRKNSSLAEKLANSGEVLDILEIHIYESFISQSKCLKRCFKRVFGKRPEHLNNAGTRRIDKDFEVGRQYQFIQFCQYELKNYPGAASAAYTYYLKHPHDKDAQHNVQLYRENFGVKDEEIIDLDRKPYQASHILGDIAYDEGNWTGVIEHFERALTDFYEEEARCRLQCEDKLVIPSSVHLSDFIHYFAELYYPILRCQVDCEDKLSRVFADHEQGYLEEHYNYLQYAYYQTGDLDRAAEAIGAFLLFNSSHPDMVRNRLFFISRLGYHDSHLRARKEAVEYVEMRNRLESLLDYAEESDESRDPEGDDRESGHYMREFEKIGIRLIQTPNELQGARFTAEGVVRGEQSEELLNMARSTPADSSGIKIISIPNAIEAVKADPDLEISLRLFLKLSEAMRLYTSRFYNQTSFYTKETKIVCREPPDSDLEKEANTEISCFPQEDGSCVDPEEKAPVGMEVNEYTGVMFINNVMEGGETVFLNRIYKPVIPTATGYELTGYLTWLRQQTKSFEAGSFEVVWGFNEYLKAQVSPKRGLFTVFEASDRHTVSPSASQRCVILMTFAPEKVKDNPEYRQAMAFLNELDEERVKKLHIDNVKRVEELEKEGVTIVQSGKELQGDERFVADGLMNKGDCQNLVSLLEAGGIEGDGYQGKSSPLSQHEVFTGLTSEKANQSAGIAGDGYKGKPEIVVSKISPHTKHEIFEGLTVGRATQLAHSGELPKDTVQLYLDVSERARLLVENFFNLTRPLYFDFTHLVCRKAITDDKGDEEERSDLSHPVHADNCLLQADGTCLRQFPAYIARDYSAVLYLNGNEDFEGGEFFFAHGNKTEQASVSPKCGRMVGFNAGDFHGVRAVRKGRRCAVAMWYTMDPNTQELARVQAQKKMALGSAVQDRTRERGGAKAGKDEEKGEENGAHHENSDVDDDKIHKHKDHLDQSENTEISEETQKQTDRVTMENEEHEEL